MDKNDTQKYVNGSAYILETSFKENLFTEKEPNNKFENSTPIQLNTLYSGSFLQFYQSDLDYYTFTLSEKKQVTLSFTRLHLSMSFIINKKDETSNLWSWTIKGDEDLKEAYLDKGNPAPYVSSFNKFVEEKKVLEAGTYYMFFRPNQSSKINTNHTHSKLRPKIFNRYQLL